MADPATRKMLHDLARDEGLQNKTCADCGNPNPQWASISFAVFICLQCAGEHRGFGVHISFVRSISMDAWQDDQLRRMKLGGNGVLMDFLRAYAADGGYRDGMSTREKYHCWAATQYREKLTATLEGREWAPAPAPAPDAARPASAQGLRKARARGSPAPRQGSDTPPDDKAAKESYFATLGASNAARPDDLPPSQGGRYTGFGSGGAEGPPAGGAPLDAVGALSRGWTVFAGAVAGASRAVSENVLQPGMERVADPELRARVGGYVGAAGQRAAEAAGSANAWGRERFGVDVGERVGSVVERVRGGAAARGYTPVDRGGDVGDDGGDGGDGGGGGGDARGRYDPGKTEKPDWDEWKEF